MIEIESLRAEVDESNERAATLKEQNETLANEMADANSRAASLSAENESAQETINNLSDEMKTIEQHVSELKSQRQSAED